MDHTVPNRRARAKAARNSDSPVSSPAANPAWPAGFAHRAGYLAPRQQRALLAAIEAILAAAPLYRPAMPRSGKPLSVEMTNAGPLGWVTDKDGGYRYQAFHPVSRQPWPPIPELLLALWRELAAYPAPPEACLVNVYEPGTKLGSHVDADEADAAAPVLSVSLGADALFHIGGLHRTDPKSKLVLRSGDIVILGGSARHCYHGIDRILPTLSPLLNTGQRINLTLRRVTLPA